MVWEGLTVRVFWVTGKAAIAGGSPFSKGPGAPPDMFLRTREMYFENETLWARLTTKENLGFSPFKPILHESQIPAPRPALEPGKHS